MMRSATKRRSRAVVATPYRPPCPPELRQGLTKYIIRPASPEGPIRWASRSSHRFYVEVVRLADGASIATWGPPAPFARWYGGDDWAHRQWTTWTRMGFQPQFSGCTNG